MSSSSDITSVTLTVPPLKRVILFLSLSWLLNSCLSSKPLSNCPLPPDPPLTLKVLEEADIYHYLQSLDIATTDKTVTFQSRYHDFTFCRGNQTWTVQPGTYKPLEPSPETYEEAIARLGDPPYQSVDLQGQTYQYRVLLDPNPFPDFKTKPQQVILELIQPKQSQPERQVLYNLAQVKAKQAGIQLGVPAITATLVHNNHLYWAISPEQGEGNGGIATIANYDPKTDTFRVMQPPEIARQQINDMAITGKPTQPIFWLATQTSGEGNPYLPGMGLVAYRPDSGSVTAYHGRNSPLVGFIPHQVQIDQEWLWVGTGNGVCRLQWQTVETSDSWQCWQFTWQTKLPTEGVKIYPSLLASKSQATLKPTQTGETIEVLWWSPQDYQTRQGRYEVVYQLGFTVTLKDGGIPWSDYYHDSHGRELWDDYGYWPGKDWIWRGDRFVRPFDGVPLNSFGGGPTGISVWNMPQQKRPEIYAMRGDLHLINLTKASTEVQYYSGWVDDNKLIQPYLSLVPSKKPQLTQPNPLESLSFFKK